MVLFTWLTSCSGFWLLILVESLFSFACLSPLNTAWQSWGNWKYWLVASWLTPEHEWQLPDILNAYAQKSQNITSAPPQLCRALEGKSSSLGKGNKSHLLMGLGETLTVAKGHIWWEISSWTLCGHHLPHGGSQALIWWMPCPVLRGFLREQETKLQTSQQSQDANNYSLVIILQTHISLLPTSSLLKHTTCWPQQHCVSLLKVDIETTLFYLNL